VPDAHPPRCRPLSPEVVTTAADVTHGTPEAELLDRLDDALAALPSPERAAVVTALGYGEDVASVAPDLGLTPEDTEILVRSALQLLRGALADVELDDSTDYARVVRRRSAVTRRPID